MSVSAPDYIPIAITSGTAIVVSISTGFGAATLKHRWDSQDEQKRWDREREQRYQEALREAFVNYFTARYNVVDAYLLLPIRPAAEELNRATMMVASQTRAQERLRLFLEDTVDFADFAVETTRVAAFTRDHLARMEEVHAGAAEPTTPRPDIPDDSEVNALAHKLLYSPARSTSPRSAANSPQV